MRQRVALVIGAVLAAALALSVTAWAEHSLYKSAQILGFIDLRLSYNSGVAFSLGANAPEYVVLTITTLTIVVLVTVAMWFAPKGTPIQLLAAALALGGAMANQIDRLRDGLVTDYFHSGWWPTFNLADVAIVVGATLFVVSTRVAQPSAETSR